MFESEKPLERIGMEPASPDEMPVWRKPTITVLDVESGTLTTTGPVPDGNGSTS